MQVSSTAKLLLDVYRDCRVHADEHLTMRALITTKLSWHREHQDNFQVALEELISCGYLEKGASGLVLTGEGYHFLNKDKVNSGKSGRHYKH